MKRDWNLIREILLHIEKNGKEIGMVHSISGLTGYPKDEIQYHLHILLERGLIEGRTVKSWFTSEVTGPRLTWRGHDFLDLIQNQGIWDHTQKRLEVMSGRASFGIIQMVALNAVKKLVLD